VALFGSFSLTAMKIGVLTFHRCINYGSYWQARLLVEALRSRGHHAVLLDPRSRRLDIAEWRCALQPVLPTAAPPSDRRLYMQKTRRLLAAIAALPSSTGFAMDDPGQMEDFDLVLVGSDEVWNLEHPWYGGQPLFFGEGVRAKRLVAYAASCGNYRSPGGLPREWAERLERFEHISVRDDNARQLVEQARGRAPELVLDPCLQFGAGARDRPRAREPWVAVYGHNFGGWFSRGVRQWAVRRGLRLVSIGYRNDWADAQWIAAGPDDFARCMAGARAVVTNFFHGCVFALRHEVPFLCENSSYRMVKIRDLLGSVGGEAHLAREGSPAALFDAALSEPPSCEIQRRIDARRHASQAFLDRVLERHPASAERPAYA
jgi:hypothetical protein